MVQQSQQAREREQQLNQQLTETSEQVCIVHELVIVLLMVQQSQQAREREQQLNQQLTETSEQVCIVHELVIVLLMVVTGIEPATDQRERDQASDQREGVD